MLVLESVSEVYTPDGTPVQPLNSWAIVLYQDVAGDGVDPFESNDDDAILLTWRGLAWDRDHPGMFMAAAPVVPDGIDAFVRVFNDRNFVNESHIGDATAYVDVGAWEDSVIFRIDFSQSVVVRVEVPGTDPTGSDWRAVEGPAEPPEPPGPPVGTPSVDIKANGEDGQVSVRKSGELSVTIGVDAGPFAGLDVDWWLLMDGPNGRFHYHPLSGRWDPGSWVSYQGPLRDVSDVEVVRGAPDTPGVYDFYFGVDTPMDGELVLGSPSLYRDRVTVRVLP
jgi:hypothetical protein